MTALIVLTSVIAYFAVGCYFARAQKQKSRKTAKLYGLGTVYRYDVGSVMIFLWPVLVPIVAMATIGDWIYKRL